MPEKLISKEISKETEDRQGTFLRYIYKMHQTQILVLECL